MTSNTLENMVLHYTWLLSPSLSCCPPQDSCTGLINLQPEYHIPSFELFYFLLPLTGILFAQDNYKDHSLNLFKYCYHYLLFIKIFAGNTI